MYFVVMPKIRTAERRHATSILVADVPLWLLWRASFAVAAVARGVAVLRSLAAVAVEPPTSNLYRRNSACEGNGEGEKGCEVSNLHDGTMRETKKGKAQGCKFNECD